MKVHLSHQNQVIRDLEDLDINISFDQISKMKKSEYMKIIKEKVEIKALKELEEIKDTHTKVKHIKNMKMKMEKYLSPTSIVITQEERELIFKMRCRVTETKMNMKHKYETHECDVCGQENETQEHILKCSEIIKLNNKLKNSKIPNYTKLFNGKVSAQLEIARIFKQNMKIKQSITEK